MKAQLQTPLSGSTVGRITSSPRKAPRTTPRCSAHLRPRKLESHFDLRNAVDKDSMSQDPGSFGKVADHMLDFELAEQPHHKIVSYRRPAAPAAAAPLQEPAAAAPEHGPDWYHDPHHLSNVDTDPMSSDPGDLGRVAQGVLEGWEKLND